MVRVATVVVLLGAALIFGAPESNAQNGTPLPACPSNPCNGNGNCCNGNGNGNCCNNGNGNCCNNGNGNCCEPIPEAHFFDLNFGSSGRYA